jgi:hypothetical protein
MRIEDEADFDAIARVLALAIAAHLPELGDRHRAIRGTCDVERHGNGWRDPLDAFD